MTAGPGPEPGAVRDAPDRKRFELEHAGVVAFVTYRTRDGVVSLLHTEVPPEHEGLGLGSALILGTLRLIRARGEQVLPFCPFVHAYIRQHGEHLDLVAARYPRLDDLSAGPSGT